MSDQLTETTQRVLLPTDWWRTGRAPSNAKTLKFLPPHPLPFSNSRWYRPKEMAEILGYRSTKTVLEKIRAGEIQALPLERGYLVSGKYANAYLERLRLKRAGGGS